MIHWLTEPADHLPSSESSTLEGEFYCEIDFLERQRPAGCGQ